MCEVSDLVCEVIDHMLTSYDDISVFGQVESSGSPFAPRCSASGQGLLNGSVGQKSEFTLVLNTKAGKPYMQNIPPVVIIQSPQGNTLTEGNDFQKEI